MFTPHAEASSAELLRVCRPGGRIGLANWTPSSFVGQLLKTACRYVPPPAEIRSPLEWGEPERLGELFAGHSVHVESREFVFRYRSARDWLDTFRTYYGPTVQAFAAIDDAARLSLERELLDLADACNTATNGTVRIPSEYLEVVVTTR